MKNSNTKKTEHLLQAKLSEIEAQEVTLSKKPYAALVQGGNPTREALKTITDIATINGEKSLFSSVSWPKILLLLLLVIALAAGDGFLVKTNVETNFSLDPKIAYLLGTLALAMSLATTKFLKTPLIEYHTKRSSRSKRLISFIIGTTVAIFLLIILGVGFFAEESAKKNDTVTKASENIQAQSGFAPIADTKDITIPMEEPRQGLSNSTISTFGLIFTMLLTLGLYLILIFLETYLVIFYQVKLCQRLDDKLTKAKDEMLKRIQMIGESATILDDIERQSIVLQKQITHIHTLPPTEELQNPAL